MQTRRYKRLSCEQRSSDLRWCHPLIGFHAILAGVGFCISHLMVAIGVIAVVLLEWFDVQIYGAWQAVATTATMVFGVAVLFAFAGWIARIHH